MAYCSAVAAVVTTTSISVGAGGPGTAVFDGINLGTGSPAVRILLTGQSTPAQNGVWLFKGSSTQMTRPVAAGDPFITGSTLDYAIAVPVTGGPNGGLTWGGSEWWMSSPTSGAATVDTTPLTFVRRNARPVQARFVATSSVTLSSPGSVIDGTTVSDGAMTTGASSTTLTCSTSHPFTLASVGMTIVVVGAGASGANLATTIASYTSSSVVTLTSGCSTTVTGATVYLPALVVNDVVLLVAQNTVGNNGLYLWMGPTTALTRTADPIYPNIEVQVSEGNTGAHASYKLVTQGSVAVGTTALTFSKQILRANVRDFGATGNNSTNDTVAIQAAYGSIPSTGGVLTFPAGTYLCNSANFTIPAYVQVQLEQGAILSPSSHTVTISGQVNARPTQQIFAAVGTGAIILANAASEAVPVGWFGPTGGGTSDDTPSIKAAYAAIPSTRECSGACYSAVGGAPRSSRRCSTTGWPSALSDFSCATMVKSFFWSTRSEAACSVATRA